MYYTILFKEGYERLFEGEVRTRTGVFWGSAIQNPMFKDL